LREIIPDVRGQTIADEEGPRMTIEEQQQVEVACVLQAPDTVEEIPDLRRRHERPTAHVGSACATAAKAFSVPEKKNERSMVRALRFSGCR
jgi:hypothetical protein